MLKAIETRYKGYRMRSRLEARWAVFFDALGVPWEYEKEGFDLGKGRRYLPDFWLGAPCDCWIEIKPDTLGDSVLHDDYWPLMYDFSEQLSTTIIACVGVPGSAHCYMFRHGHVVWDGATFPYYQGNVYDRAVTAARSARFEHGERP